MARILPKEAKWAETPLSRNTPGMKHPPVAVPGAPPALVTAYPESSSSLRVVWEPPPENKQNGVISYYKIFYVARARSDSEATVIEIKNPGAREFVIDELLKWTNYRIWMLAGTSVGDGPKSAPIDIKTDEDGRCSVISLPYDAALAISEVLEHGWS